MFERSVRAKPLENRGCKDKCLFDFFFWPMIDTLLSRNFSEFDWPPGQVQFAQLAMHQRVNEIAFFSIIVVVK